VGSDWNWVHVSIAHGGDQITVVETPETTDKWYFTGFAISKQHGFALTDTTIEVFILFQFVCGNIFNKLFKLYLQLFH